MMTKMFLKYILVTPYPVLSFAQLEIVCVVENSGGPPGRTKVKGCEYLHTNVQRMGNKKEEFELLLQTEDYDILRFGWIILMMGM